MHSQVEGVSRNTLPTRPSDEEIASRKTANALAAQIKHSEYQNYIKSRRSSLQETLVYLVQDRRVHLRFIHVRRTINEGELDPKGGATIAYSNSPHSNVAYFSVVWCNPSDLYCRLEGAIRTADAFENGQSTTFMNRKKITMCAALYEMVAPFV